MTKDAYLYFVGDFVERFSAFYAAIQSIGLQLEDPDTEMVQLWEEGEPSEIAVSTFWTKLHTSSLVAFAFRFGSDDWRFCVVSKVEHLTRIDFDLRGLSDEMALLIENTFVAYARSEPALVGLVLDPNACVDVVDWDTFFTGIKDVGEADCPYGPAEVMVVRNVDVHRLGPLRRMMSMHEEGELCLLRALPPEAWRGLTKG